VAEFLVQYVLTSVRFARVEALTIQDAIEEVKSNHYDLDYESETESVLITKAEADQ